MHKFNPEHIGRLLRRERVREIKPSRLLRELGLKRGDVFFDIGCGPGFFTLPAARIVGPKGRVYAVDTEKKMLEELKRRNPPENVVPIKSEESRVPVKEGIADFVLIAYVLHETEDKLRFLVEMKRIMKPGASLVVIDWKKKREEHGPPREERLTAGEVKGLVREAGLGKIEAGTLNPSHYIVTAEKRA